MGLANTENLLFLSAEGRIDMEVLHYVTNIVNANFTT